MLFKVYFLVLTSHIPGLLLQILLITALLPSIFIRNCMSSSGVLTLALSATTLFNIRLIVIVLSTGVGAITTAFFTIFFFFFDFGILDGPVVSVCFSEVIDVHY